MVGHESYRDLIHLIHLQLLQPNLQHLQILQTSALHVQILPLSLQETQDMLDFCAKHGITCPHELIPADPAKVNEAYERAIKSDVRRAQVEPPDGRNWWVGWWPDLQSRLCVKVGVLKVGEGLG